MEGFLKLFVVFPFCKIIKRCDGRLKNADMTSPNLRQFSLDFLPFFALKSSLLLWHDIKQILYVLRTVVCAWIVSVYKEFHMM